MRKLVFLAGLFAAACGQGGDQASTNAGKAAAPARPRGPVQTATLTGLYESGESPPSQLCITGQGNGARFGLVTRAGGQPGCSGAGTAVRTGSTLRLIMSGDSACTIEARIESGRVTFPARLPQSCAYYCRPGAPVAGLALSKTGGTQEDALRARDLIGDPLCA